MKPYRSDLAYVVKCSDRVKDYGDFLENTDQQFYKPTIDQHVRFMLNSLHGAVSAIQQLGRSGALDASTQSKIETTLAPILAAKQELAPRVEICPTAYQQDRKYAFARYCHELKDPCITPQCSQCSCACADLLQTWISVRFCETQHTGYRIEDFPNHVFSFVLMYTYMYTQGKLQEFLQEFSSWCSMVRDGLNQNTTPWLVYHVFQASDKSEFITTEAYDVWEDMKTYIYVSLFRDPKLKWRLDTNAFRWYMQNGPEGIQELLYSHQLRRMQEGV